MAPFTLVRALVTHLIGIIPLMCHWKRNSSSRVTEAVRGAPFDSLHVFYQSFPSTSHSKCRVGTTVRLNLPEEHIERTVRSLRAVLEGERSSVGLDELGRDKGS